MSISTKRVYEPAAADDGVRILVDRLWPRGLTKEKARIDLWPRDVAPSTELRRWYQHDPEKWAEFRRRYFEELRAHEEVVAEIAERAGSGDVTFVFSSRETELNNATALKEYVERML